jgi:hypothetical protein
MEDLYLKDDPFNLKAKTSVEASGQGIKDKNVEASHAASAGSDSPVSEKGNVTKTQESDESAVKNLGLDALNAAIGTMNGDTAVSDGDKGGDTAHQTLEIPESEQNVEPDVETSLGQQDNQGVNETHSSATSQPKHTEADVEVPENTVELVSEDEGTSVHLEQEVVDVENLVDEEPISKAFGIAKRLRSNKGKAVAAMVETPQPVKKPKGKGVSVGPKKAWSKVTPKTSAVKTRKRKAESSSESDHNVEEDVSNIPATSSVVKKTVKRVPPVVKFVATDNISFHYPEYASRWKFVFQRRMALERELGAEALKIDEIVNLIKEAGLMKTVSKLGPCYEQLVKEFLVNIPEDCDDPTSDDFQTVFVRGEKIKFSPKVINDYLGITEAECEKLTVSDNQICKVLTANQVKVWPKKGKISSGKLSVKYAMLNRIAATNWVPTTHSSDIATGLGRLIYAIGTHQKFNYGEFIFEQTIKHAKTTAVKLPIAFPTLLCAIILDQQPTVKNVSDEAKKREPPLSFHFKLFAKHHVPDIVGTSSSHVPVVGTSRKDIIDAMKETCSMLDEKKVLFGRMITALENEDQRAEGDNNQENDNEAEDEENSSEDAENTASSPED